MCMCGVWVFYAVVVAIALHTNVHVPFNGIWWNDILTCYLYAEFIHLCDQSNVLSRQIFGMLRFDDNAYYCFLSHLFCSVVLFNMSQLIHKYWIYVSLGKKFIQFSEMWKIPAKKATEEMIKFEGDGAEY